MKLAEARKRAGHSQYSLARILGIPRTTLLGWERGMRSPSIHWGLRIASELGLRAEEIDWPPPAGERCATPVPAVRA